MSELLSFPCPVRPPLSYRGCRQAITGTAWFLVRDSDGKTFFFNSETKKSVRKKVRSTRCRADKMLCAATHRRSPLSLRALPCPPQSRSQSQHRPWLRLFLSRGPGRAAATNSMAWQALCSQRHPTMKTGPTRVTVGDMGCGS